MPKLTALQPTYQYLFSNPEFLSAGDSIEDVLEEFPALTRKDVLACIRFSSRLMGHRFSVLEVA
jgi:hypothetical protein